jgi:putative two-component system response regulator
MLLDLIMPQTGGFDVLRFLRENNLLEYIPVVIVSSEASPKSIRRSFELGAIDYIRRPFDPEIVLQRVRNTIMLYKKQNQLRSMVVEQVREKERSNTLLCDILATIVEFRNGESGLHVVQIRVITEILLNALRLAYPKYGLTEASIALISNAAGLHDVGKILVPENILNKPGKLTDDEFDVMRIHTVSGEKMLKNLRFGTNEPLVKYARQICRWHHERWDGKGYPDGLMGDETPIAAQVTALADVYDALTTERVYKPIFSHKKAVKMIKNGECGQFNPDLMSCFLSIEKTLQSEIRARAGESELHIDHNEITSELMAGVFIAPEGSLYTLPPKRLDSHKLIANV